MVLPQVAKSQYKETLWIEDPTTAGSLRLRFYFHGPQPGGGARSPGQPPDRKYHAPPPALYPLFCTPLLRQDCGFFFNGNPPPIEPPSLYLPSGFWAKRSGTNTQTHPPTTLPPEFSNCLSLTTAQPTKTFHHPPPYLLHSFTLTPRSYTPYPSTNPTHLPANC